MKIPYDKWLHFGAGLLVAILAGLAFNPVLGLSLAILAGILKEIRDWFVYRGPDWRDALATWLGGLLGTLVLEAASWMF